MRDPKQPPIFVRINKDQVQTTDLFQSLHINENNLQSQMCEQPKEFFFWCACLAELKKRVKDLVAQREKLESDIAAKEQSDGKKRKFDIKYVIAQSPRWIMLSASIRACEYSRDVADGAVKAFEQRNELLQSINANKRKERWDA